MKTERIQLIVDVDIQYETKGERAFAVQQSKQNVMMVSNGWVCEPKKVKLLKSKK